MEEKMWEENRKETKVRRRKSEKGRYGPGNTLWICYLRKNFQLTTSAKQSMLLYTKT